MRAATSRPRPAAAKPPPPSKRPAGQRGDTGGGIGTRVSRSRLVTGTGIAAGVAANYWLLEGPLADRTDVSGGWVSDLGARSEPSGWIFDLLDAGSGLLLLAFALLIRPLLATRGRWLRRGSVALIVAGACALVDGAFPLSCAESLPGDCELSYDWIDVVHVTETFVAIAATIASFGFLAAGLIGDGDARLRRLGYLTAAASVAWITCNLLMGISYLDGGLEDVRGVFHRASQVVLGLWLAALAVGAPRGAVTSPGIGRIDGDGQAAEQVRMR